MNDVTLTLFNFENIQQINLLLLLLNKTIDFTLDFAIDYWVETNKLLGKSHL